MTFFSLLPDPLVTVPLCTYTQTLMSRPTLIKYTITVKTQQNSVKTVIIKQYVIKIFYSNWTKALGKLKLLASVLSSIAEYLEL